MNKVACPECFGTGWKVDHRLVGQCLKKLRKRPLRDMAASMGISASLLCLLEQGKRKWTEDVIAKYKECCQ